MKAVSHLAEILNSNGQNTIIFRNAMTKHYNWCYNYTADNDKTCKTDGTKTVFHNKLNSRLYNKKADCNSAVQLAHLVHFRIHDRRVQPVHMSHIFVDFYACFDVAIFCGFRRLLVKTSTRRNVDNQNVDRPKRPQTETSTSRNVNKSKRRQTETSTRRNVDKPIRRQTETSTKPKRRQTKTSTSRNVDKPKRRHC